MLNLQSIYFGQRHSQFDSNDYDIICKVKRLYHKHQRQCENDCNGIGYVKGELYYTGSIDDWARQKYGQHVKSGYVDDNTTVFYAEIERIEAKINNILLRHMPPVKFKVEFQHDPRGNTVKLFYRNEVIEW